MGYKKCVYISLSLILSSILIKKTYGYTEIYQSQLNSTAQKPKIFKALHTDLNLPIQLNQHQVTTTRKSTDVYQPIFVTPTISTKPNQPIFVTPIQQKPEPYSTTTQSTVISTTSPITSGRAIYNQPNFPFLRTYQNLQQPKPLVYRINSVNSHSPTIRKYGQPVVKDGIRDRFTPAEAVVSGLLKSKNKNNNRYRTQYQAAGSNINPTYNYAPSDIYAFPPNTNSKYPLPTHDARAVPIGNNVSSYLPPPSGPLDYNQMDQSASSSNNQPSTEGTMISGHDDPIGGTDDQIGVLPASAMLAPNVNTDDQIGVLTASDMLAPNGDSDDQIGVLPASAMPNSHEIDEHKVLHSHDDGQIYYTPPPGWIESSHDSSETYTIHDDHDFHHHAPHIIYKELSPHPIEIPSHVPPPPPTAAPPLPPPPPEPRVKKYSYFYIGRKLWYIPLYFTVWFSFYVLWLILKSIARHKVNLPNNYTGTTQTLNRRNMRSLNNEVPGEHFINDLTQKILDAIESYKIKHLN